MKKRRLPNQLATIIEELHGECYYKNQPYNLGSIETESGVVADPTLPPTRSSTFHSAGAIITTTTSHESKQKTAKVNWKQTILAN